MVQIQIDMSKELNKKVEVFKAENGCPNKRDAVLLMIKKFK